MGEEMVAILARGGSVTEADKVQKTLGAIGTLLSGELKTLDAVAQTEGAVLDPDHRGALLHVILDPATKIEIRRRALKCLKKVDDLTNEAHTLMAALVRFTIEPDSELVRHLARCVRPKARTNYLRERIVSTLERLLDIPELDGHARAEVIATLGEVIDVADAERLLLRAYRDDEERARVGMALSKVLSRRLVLRELTPTGFEVLCCRMLEARERSQGRSVFYQSIGGSWDGGIDGLGSQPTPNSADDAGKLDGVVQCKNVDRVRADEVGAFISQADVFIRKKPDLWKVEPRAVKRLYVTAATKGDIEKQREFAASHGVELICGQELVQLVRTHLRSDVVLSD